MIKFNTIFTKIKFLFNNKKDINKELLNSDNNIPLFSFDGIITKAKIVDIYDGDTFSACFIFNNKIIKYKCRSFGYDCPEIRPLLKMKNRNIVLIF